MNYFYTGQLETQFASWPRAARNSRDMNCISHGFVGNAVHIPRLSDPRTIAGNGRHGTRTLASPAFLAPQYFDRVVGQRPDRWMITSDMIISILSAPARREREQNGRIRLGLHRRA
jgi:hypothetical protein